MEIFNDISLLADLMGHESIETTRIYLRRSSAEQQKIVDKVGTVVKFRHYESIGRLSR